MSRHFWVIIHRYAGLYMAFFLIVAGLTGSVLAFYPELNKILTPPKRVSVQDRTMLNPFDLRDLALAMEPRMLIDAINLHPEPGEVFTVGWESRINPKTFRPYDLDQLILNPYTGELISTEARPLATVLLPITRKNILHFILKLHYSLLLDEVGIWLFGIAAFIWTIDCFIGFYLTLPMRRNKSTRTALRITQANFWQRWQIAWVIKYPASRLRLNFDLHRAGGLWSWIILLIFAWSSVLLNLKNQIYTPVMEAFFEMTNFNNYPIPDLPKSLQDPTLEFRHAYSIGKSMMAEQAKNKNFTVLTEQSFQYYAAKGLYLYMVKTDRDIGDLGTTILCFDANNAKFVSLFLQGEKVGDAIKSWLQALHMAKIWGLPYKIFVCLMGLVVAMLSVTGVYIWLKKRRVRFVRRC